jgi:hypothetical protein
MFTFSYASEWELFSTVNPWFNRLAGGGGMLNLNVSYLQSCIWKPIKNNIKFFFGRKHKFHKKYNAACL